MVKAFRGDIDNRSQVKYKSYVMIITLNVCALNLYNDSASNTPETRGFISFYFME